MNKRITNKLGFRLEQHESAWWIVWADETLSPATEEAVRLWEQLEAEVKASELRKKIRAT